MRRVAPHHHLRDHERARLPGKPQNDHSPCDITTRHRRNAGTNWQSCGDVIAQMPSTVCAGRVVNAYRPNDLVLSIVHRAANLELGVAGLAEVQSEGIENFDVSGVVAAHHRYRHHTADVLSLIGLEEAL